MVLTDWGFVIPELLFVVLAAIVGVPTSMACWKETAKRRAEPSGREVRRGVYAYLAAVGFDLLGAAGPFALPIALRDRPEFGWGVRLDVCISIPLFLAGVVLAGYSWAMAQKRMGPKYEAWKLGSSILFFGTLLCFLAMVAFTSAAPWN